MKKVLALIICATIVFGVCACLAGCSGDSNNLNNRLIGKWEAVDKQGANESVEFFKDGSCTPIEFGKFEYCFYTVYENGTIVFEKRMSITTLEITYYTATYSLDNNILTIDDMEFKKAN